MIRVRQVKVDARFNSIDKIKEKVAKKIKIDISEINNIRIRKESIDARDKNNIYFVYEVDINVKNEKTILKKNHNNDVLISPNLDYFCNYHGNIKLNNRPIIVGSGPAGLFCAYILCEKGVKPIIIERGKDIKERKEDVEKFWNFNILNEESNVQYGLGGAGTFSDGKLNTLVKDENNRGRKVFETFIKFGAKEDILFSYKPHIGTDELEKVVSNMKDYLIKEGCEFRFNNKLTNIIYENNKIKQIELNNDELVNTDIVVLAIGNSSRDTFKMLYENKINMESKPFAVGVRVEHLQKDIDLDRLGSYADYLTPATYKLTYQSSNKRGVYSFCMCPGGYVVNASSKNEHIVVNGMSYSKRDSKNANSAIIVTVTKDDFGTNVLDGIKFQEKLEKKAYEIGKGNVPIQKLIDFKNNVKTTELGIIEPIHKGDYEFANLNEILPDYISAAIKEAFDNYKNKIKCFSDDDVILSGVETRSSSPIRIIRNDLFESNIEGIYPCGEGSGYAGGITTSAIDGIKVAEQILKKYCK